MPVLISECLYSQQKSLLIFLPLSLRPHSAQRKVLSWKLLPYGSGISHHAFIYFLFIYLFLIISVQVYFYFLLEYFWTEKYYYCNEPTQNTLWLASANAPGDGLHRFWTRIQLLRWPEGCPESHSFGDLVGSCHHLHCLYPLCWVDLLNMWRQITS